MKLNIGCGKSKIDGWVNIDAVPSLEPDLLHNISSPLPYPESSIDEIMAHGVLEHFDKYMRTLIISDWIRVLKINGLIHLQIPDFQKLLSKFRKFEFDDFVDTLFGETLWNSENYIGHYGIHKWGYSKESLIKFLSKFGISPIKVKTNGLNIDYIGMKTKDIHFEEIENIVIHSHNNKFGAPNSSICIKEFKLQLNRFKE